MHPNEIGGCSKIAKNSRVRMSIRTDTRSKTQIAEIMGNTEHPVVPLERNLYGHPLAGLLCER